MFTAAPFPLHGRFARISRPKLHNMPGQHEGVLMPHGLVAHTTAGRSLEIVSYWDFAQGLPVKLEHELYPRDNDSAAERLAALMRQRAPYDPVFGNCETVARKVMGEPGISWQIVVGGLLVAGLVALAQA